MNDDLTKISDLRKRVAQFVAERDWQQFHTPKNLCMALAVEVAELMKHLQWLDPQEVQARSPRAEQCGADIPACHF